MKLNPGDRVRVTFEGKVSSIPAFGAPGGFRVEGPSGHMHIIHGDQAYTVEIVEPEYVDGALYQDARGRAWRYDNTIPVTPWSLMGSAGFYSRVSPTRPLVRLVPEVTE